MPNQTLLQIVLYLHNRLERAQKNGDADLTLSQYRLLYMVREGPARSVELATASDLTKPSVGARVAQMEDAGWIERRPVAKDRRAASIRITPAGRRVLARFEAAMQAALQDFLGAEPLADADGQLGWLLEVIQQQRQQAHLAWQLRKSEAAGKP